MLSLHAHGHDLSSVRQIELHAIFCPVDDGWCVTLSGAILLQICKRNHRGSCQSQHGFPHFSTERHSPAVCALKRKRGLSYPLDQALTLLAAERIIEHDSTYHRCRLQATRWETMLTSARFRINQVQQFARTPTKGFLPHRMLRRVFVRLQCRRRSKLFQCGEITFEKISEFLS